MYLDYKGRNKTRVETYYFFQTFSMWHLWMFGFWPIFCTIVRYKISHLGCHTCYENKHFKSVWEGQLVHNNVCLEYRTQNILKEYDILNKHYYAQVGLLIPIWNVYFRNMYDTLDEILYRTIQRCQMEKVWKKVIRFYSILFLSLYLIAMIFFVLAVSLFPYLSINSSSSGQFFLSSLITCYWS